MAKFEIITAAIGAAVETALAAAHSDLYAPGAGFAASSLALYILKRQENARIILRGAFERASASDSDFPKLEELAAGLYRYSRAVRDQAADENLQILAETMVGLARRNELWASDFLRYADILAPLGRDELILIGRLMAERKKFYASPRPPNSNSDLWKIVVGQAEELFGNTEYLYAIAARAQSSGIIVLESGSFAGTYYYLSPIGINVQNLVDVETALNKMIAPGELSGKGLSARCTVRKDAAGAHYIEDVHPLLPDGEYLLIVSGQRLKVRNTNGSWHTIDD